MSSDVGSSKIREDDHDASTATTSTAAAESEPKTATKRQFLEVNNAETVKKLLVKSCETKPVKPSEALARVRNFLPLLKESTEKLVEEARANPTAVDIENVGEDDEHIEMNLAFMPDDSDSEDEDEEQDDSDEDSEEEDEKEASGSDNSPVQGGIHELGLGFKVNDPNQIKRLKLEKTDCGKISSKKPLICEVEQKEENQDDEAKSSDATKIE